MEVIIDNITIKDGYNMEDIARCIYLNIVNSQSDDMPYILTIDGSNIKILKSLSGLPTSWEYQTKRVTRHSSFDVVEYYLRDRISDTLYCIFGIDTVLKVFPDIISFCELASMTYKNKGVIIEKEPPHENINITRCTNNGYSMEIIKYSTPITEPIKITPL